MVKATDTIPRLPDGRVDVEAWSRRLDTDQQTGTGLIASSLSLIRGLDARSDELLERGLELANLVLVLNMDPQSVSAALLYLPVRTGALTLDQVRVVTGAEVASLVEAVVRLADTSLLEMSSSRMQASESRNQVENIKRMLVSMVDDPRVAVLKLAERTVALRGAKNSSPERQARIAQEAHQIFAPLANRLGVWQLKWELEDLALRYLAPEIYKAIAGQLDGRRAEREREIQDIVEVMEARLAAKNIQAKVFGRAKHIYSIWRKMRSKKVGMNEVYDVRAIRVVVPDIGQCYSALGVIHTEWQHIPSEFDDYIAVPKENGYRSIHTAVSWSDGKTLEVQIRTPEMHEDAELGVCAHWVYKDGTDSEDDFYSRKMNWMRQVVEWQEEAESRIRENQIGLELGTRAREERIFVYTPKGHVLDLTTGATPLDFAYRVHTEIGHRCIGARVDGRPVALNEPLESGQRVEVLTGSSVRPQRVWLHEHLGCLHSSRAREKVSEWFRDRSASENEAEGRALLERSLGRLGTGSSADAQTLARAASGLGFEDVAACLQALGSGRCQILDLLAEILPPELCRTGTGPQPAQLSLLDDVPRRTARGPGERYDIRMLADDRPGLLLDVTAFLDSQEIMLLSNSGRILPDAATAAIEVEVRLNDLLELFSLMDALEMIPGVRDARRVIQPDENVR